jgi:hypothetical protein
MIKRIAMCSALLATAVASPSESRAQQWTIDGHLGQSAYQSVAATSGTSNGVVGLRYSGPRTWFYLSAAAPLEAGDPAWSATGVGRRLQAGWSRVTAGLDVGAHVHGYGDPAAFEPGFGGVAEVHPFVGVRTRMAGLEIASGPSFYGSAFAGQVGSRRVHETSARVVASGGSPLELGARARHVAAEEASYRYLEGTALVDLGPARIWGSLGQWFSSALPGVAWTAGTSLELTRSLDVWGSVRRDVSDPLYLNDPRRSWNVGASHRIGARAVTRSVLTPAAIPSGRVTIRIPATEARETPWVAGDFTAWEPIPMQRAGESWVVSVALEAGVYHYSFRTAQGEWFVPDSVPGRREDGFGGFVAVLVVR